MNIFKNKYVMVASVAVFAIIIVLLFSKAFTGGEEEIVLEEGGQVQSKDSTDLGKVEETPVPVETVERSLNGLSEAENKKRVLETATAMLNLTDIIPLTTEDLGMAVESLALDSEGVTNEELEKFVLFDEDDKEESVEVLQALATFSYMISLTSINQDITPSMDYNSVVLMNDLGLAFVPIYIYTGDGNAFNFLFTWDEDDWRLVPYPLFEQIRMMSMSPDVEETLEFEETV